MFSRDQYELIDFGGGRKLERFDNRLIDRPCPTADTISCRDSAVWGDADGYFERRSGLQGDWRWRDDLSTSPWRLIFRFNRDSNFPKTDAEICFQLRSTPAGQVGIFPEQAANWNWLRQTTAACVDAGRCNARDASDESDWRPKVLNLFAYTGGSTLAAAAAGASVVHIDGARNVVNWARDNAEASGLAAAPIRWIVEDAPRFVARERKRGNRYRGIVLDPPTYGHGPKGQAWSIHTNLESLVHDCAALLEGDDAFLLLTCHTPELTRLRLRSMVEQALKTQSRAGRVKVEEMVLPSRAGGELPSGVSLQWRGAQ